MPCVPCVRFVLTRNTLDCTQSNVYTPRALVPQLFLKICFCVLSLYTVGRLVTLDYKISFKSPSYRLQTAGKLWSTYIHTVNQIMRCWDMAVWSFPRGRRPPSWILSNRKWCRWIPKMCEWALRSVVGRSLVVGRRSVGRQYSYFLHWSHIFLFRYVRNVAREE